LIGLREEFSFRAVSAPPAEPPREPFWKQALAYARRNRTRLARFAILIVLVYAVTDLLGSAPQDVELVLPLEPLLSEAVTRPEEVEVSILPRGEEEPLAHARVRVPAELRNLHHAVRFPPGRYDVLVEARGASARQGTFEIPAEGSVRVHLEPLP
jgi:hypothetical protein